MVPCPVPVSLCPPPCGGAPFGSGRLTLVLPLPQRRFRRAGCRIRPATTGALVSGGGDSAVAGSGGVNLGTGESLARKPIGGAAPRSASGGVPSDLIARAPATGAEPTLGDAEAGARSRAARALPAGEALRAGSLASRLRAFCSPSAAAPCRACRRVRPSTPPDQKSARFESEVRSRPLVAIWDWTLAAGSSAGSLGAAASLRSGCGCRVGAARSRLGDGGAGDAARRRGDDGAGDAARRLGDDGAGDAARRRGEDGAGALARLGDGGASALGSGSGLSALGARRREGSTCAGDARSVSAVTERLAGRRARRSPSGAPQ